VSEEVIRIGVSADRDVDLGAEVDPGGVRGVANECEASVDVTGVARVGALLLLRPLDLGVGARAGVRDRGGHNGQDERRTRGAEDAPDLGAAEMG